MYSSTYAASLETLRQTAARAKIKALSWNVTAFSKALMQYVTELATEWEKKERCRATTSEWEEYLSEMDRQSTAFRHSLSKKRKRKEEEEAEQQAKLAQSDTYYDDDECAHGHTSNWKCVLCGIDIPAGSRGRDGYLLVGQWGNNMGTRAALKSMPRRAFIVGSGGGGGGGGK